MLFLLFVPLWNELGTYDSVLYKHSLTHHDDTFSIITPLAPQSYNWSQDRHFFSFIQHFFCQVSPCYMHAQTYMHSIWVKEVLNFPGVQFPFMLSSATESSNDWMLLLHTCAHNIPLSWFFLGHGLALRSTEYCRTAQFVTNSMPGCILIVHSLTRWQINL